jgi:hypothetical protein
VIKSFVETPSASAFLVANTLLGMNIDRGSGGPLATSSAMAFEITVVVFLREGIIDPEGGDGFLV